MGSGRTIHRFLAENPNGKWGFVIYRLTYDSDADWNRCIEILTERARCELEREDKWAGLLSSPSGSASSSSSSSSSPTAADSPPASPPPTPPLPALPLLSSLDWDVQSSPALVLDGASLSAVRARFRSYLASLAPSSPLLRGPRAQFCLAIDKAALDSILAAPPPPEISLDLSSWVYLIDKDWEPIDPDTYDWEAIGLDREKDDPDDEGREEVGGSKREDVGWMKVDAQAVAPRTWDLLEGAMGWGGVYVRPPRVVYP